MVQERFPEYSQLVVGKNLFTIVARNWYGAVRARWVYKSSQFFGTCIVPIVKIEIKIGILTGTGDA
jgi:hypothetical protein